MKKYSRIDRDLLLEHVRAFKKFVKTKSMVPFHSFSQNPYLYREEGYKDDVARIGRSRLKIEKWTSEDIGTGKLLKATIDAFAFKENNLVEWDQRRGPGTGVVYKLTKLLDETERRSEAERALFGLYHGDDDRESFAKLVEVFGKSYPLISYLYFLKDPSRYLPVRPQTHDQALEVLGSGLHTSQQCSWENYQEFLATMSELQAALAETLSVPVTLLNAHSFSWMLVKQMRKEGKHDYLEKYLSMSDTERSTYVKARVGQGPWRDRLLGYWGGCSVTGLDVPPLLVASHIIPWAKSSLKQRLSLYNGLLLTPALDACFDSGYISFDPDGAILISGELQKSHLKKLGISSVMKLRKLDVGHRTYLEYHRTQILR